MGDYLPSNVEQFETWLQNFVAVLTVNAATLGVDVADITPLGTARTELDAAIVDQVSKKSASKAATSLRNTKHEEGEALARAMVRRISGNPALTNDLREALGLNVSDGTRTTSSVGTEVPGIELEAQPGQVLVHFGTDPSSERTNSKPSWATGCVIYRKKSGESDFHMVGFQRTSPYVDAITGPGADYSYFVRYQGKTASDLGAQSAAETIAAGSAMAA